MKKIAVAIFRSRRLLAAIVFLMLACGTPSEARCANLWISFWGGGIESYTPGQLAKSGMPTPIDLNTFGNVTGLAFDKSHNLWAVIDIDEVVRFTAKQLKDLKHDPSPTPGVIITSTSTFSDIIGCNFDHQGNLWVADVLNGSIDELSKAQLAAGSGDVTPHVVITFSGLNPDFVTFDNAGNAWVDSVVNNQIAEFSANQLTSGGSKTPKVLLSDDGSGTSLDVPGEIAFDKKGDLWVSNWPADTVVEYAKDQLTSSGNPAPMVKLSSAIFDAPWGIAFDTHGDLVVMNSYDEMIAKFTAKQLKVSGAPIPTVSVTAGAPPDTDIVQIIFGPAS
ncbi:hypothetical protein [Candidatus Binatus sp.]|uniref:hypothetical protein n=1 Tax=Candidatus Binatus sp. TaxID=2811406 RepID=UPI002F95D342